MSKVFKFNIMTFEFEKGNVNFYKAKFESQEMRLCTEKDFKGFENIYADFSKYDK